MKSLSTKLPYSDSNTIYLCTTYLCHLFPAYLMYYVDLPPGFVRCSVLIVIYIHILYIYCINRNRRDSRFPRHCFKHHGTRGFLDIASSTTGIEVSSTLLQATRDSRFPRHYFKHHGTRGFLDIASSTTGLGFLDIALSTTGLGPCQSLRHSSLTEH